MFTLFSAGAYPSAGKRTKLLYFKVVVVVQIYSRDAKKNVRKANKQHKIHFHKHIKKKKITHLEGDCEVTDKGLQVKQPPRECVSRHI